MTNPNGRFGIHGGQYIPETLMNAVIELEAAYDHYKNDPEFDRELTELLNEYAGRPSRLYFAKKMTEDLGGAKIYLKREDLNHTGAHKINNVLGQALLAKRMGKTRLIAETGAGQHGVATATAAALLGMECVVFMGEEDTIRQALNVYRMRLLGAEVVPVKTGTATLKDAVSEAMREWTSRIADTHYCLGSVMGPHPFPAIVRDFQAVISREIKAQLLEKEGRLQRHRQLLSFHRRQTGPADRLRGGWPGGGHPGDGGHHRHWEAGYLPRDEVLFLPGPIWTDRPRLLHLSRAGLPGHWSGTRPSPRHRPGGICPGHR